MNEQAKYWFKNLTFNLLLPSTFPFKFETRLKNYFFHSSSYSLSKTHICNSHESGDNKTRNHDLKIFFRANIREIRGWTGSIKWTTFSRVTSYFLRKCQKKLFSSNLSHLAQDWSTQSFKKEIRTIKKSINIFFFFCLIEKSWFLQKLQGFQIKRQKGIKIFSKSQRCWFLRFVHFYAFRGLTSNPCNFWRNQDFLI